ncbi:MAG TPA: LysR substrate-binding domain-containing protein [Chthoniobacterales bacterium]
MQFGIMRTGSAAHYPEHHASISGLFASCPHPSRIAEEHDSVTSLMAAVEAGHGIALVAQGLDCLASSRLKIRPLQPTPPPLIVGIACRKGADSPLTRNFMAAARKASLAEALICNLP